MVKVQWLLRLMHQGGAVYNIQVQVGLGLWHQRGALCMVQVQGMLGLMHEGGQWVWCYGNECWGPLPPLMPAKQVHHGLSFTLNVRGSHLNISSTPDATV
jgi:hypothetical protein